MSAKRQTEATLVVGGGVVGICCALALQREGRDVVVVDRLEPGMGTAIASCGHIAVSEVLPLSKPGILRRIPGWLLDPAGPLTLRPRAVPALLPWLLRFAGNARPARVRAIAGELAVLTARARADYDTLLAPLQLASLIGDAPVIELYETERQYEHDRPALEARRDLGFEVEVIDGRALNELEPDLAPDFARAAIFRDWRSIVDTKRFVTAMTDTFLAAGGRREQAEVTGFTRDGDTVTGVLLADGRTLRAGTVVLAAGAWSKRLAAQLGVRLMIEGVAGYQTLLPHPGVTLRHSVVYAAGGFCITSLEQGLGIAGTIEITGLDQPPDFRRARIIADKARRVLPGLVAGDEPGDRIERVGWRPLCPDTIPVIDRAPAHPNVLIATGHGQLGVTLGATTGRLIADLAAGRTPEVDIAPYRATRFQ